MSADEWPTAFDRDRLRKQAVLGGLEHTSESDYFVNGHAASFALHAMTESNARLLEPHELAELGPPEAVRIPIELIAENPRNPRKSSTEIAELSQSIQNFGLLQPITVRRQGDRYELLGGHRRRAAFLLLAEAEPFNVGWRTIPAVIRTFDDDQSYLALLAGQLHNKNWAPKEEAAALERLAETRTLRAVGELVHRSESWVSQRLRVYADAVLSAYVQAKRLPPNTAQEFLRVREPEVRRALAEQAVAEGWSQIDARSAVRRLQVSGMVGDIGRLANDLLAALALVQPAQLPAETTAVLWKVRGRIVALGRGGPVLPSIAEAEQAAGVRTQAKTRRTRLRVD